MPKWLRTLLGVPGTDDLNRFYSRLEVVERAEWERAQQHAVMIDQLDRVYKRFAARIAREHTETPAAASSPATGQPEGESVLSMRRRLRG